MRLCCHLANMTKHFELKDPPAMELKPSIARECRWFQDGTALVVLSQHKHIDARDLASKCLNLWEKFLQTHDAT